MLLTAILFALTLRDLPDNSYYELPRGQILALIENYSSAPASDEPNGDAETAR